MNRIDMQIPTAVSPAKVNFAPTTTVQRLVMVLFEAEEEALLARRIMDLITPRNLAVLLIGVAPNPTGEAQLRRSLARLAGFLREHSSAAGRVEFRIEAGRDWIAGLRTIVRPGDMIGCYSEQTVGVMERPLCDVLSSDIGLPVYAFSGLRAARKHPRKRLSQAASWLASLASIGGFLLLQARIVIAAQGWLQTVLLLMTLGAEVGLLWFVNSLLAQS